MKKIITILFSAFLLGCAPKLSPVLKVSVYQSGKVQVNGSDVSLEELRIQLADLSQNNGVVWYYKEAGEATPPPNATEVMSLLAENRTPYSRSSKPDFSDVIDASGHSRPR